MEVRVGRRWGTMSAPEDPLTNSQIAELLATAGDDAKPPLNRAYRRASRRALLWEEEAASLYQEGRSLTELPGVGPYLEKIIRGWIEDSPIATSPPAIRENFFTLTQVRSILASRPLWSQGLRGDLQSRPVDHSVRPTFRRTSACDLGHCASADHTRCLLLARKAVHL